MLAQSGRPPLQAGLHCLASKWSEAELSSPAQLELSEAELYDASTMSRALAPLASEEVTREVGGHGALQAMGQGRAGGGRGTVCALVHSVCVVCVCILADSWAACPACGRAWPKEWNGQQVLCWQAGWRGRQDWDAHAERRRGLAAVGAACSGYSEAAFKVCAFEVSPA